MNRSNLKDNRENGSKSPRLSSSNSTDSPNNKEYNSTPSNRFYTAQEEITIRFYQVPKALFKNPVYKGLDLGPKLMYSVLRDRLDLSIKNNWQDEKGYIYLIFSGEALSILLEINKNTVTKYKRELVKYKLIIDKRIGQGNSNRIYVLKPEVKEFLNPKKADSRILKKHIPESEKCTSNDTDVNDTNLDNVNRASKEEIVENSKGEIKEYPGLKRYRSREKELLVKEIAEELEDYHSLGAFRTIVDRIPEQRIRIFLSIIKDTYLTGKIKNNRGAMFISLAKTYAGKNNINLNFR
ncbi:MAG: replication initiator protein A [Actinobacteria bacterium]|nr:replication initiator protein A [Chloroflexota bacterium]MBE3128256.1 replication initiator protein A [Actinomycetota bacterium]